MTPLARIDDEWHDDVPVARVSGEIDASNVEDLREDLRALLTNRSAALVIDLSETTYLDSAGINLLFALGEEMRGRQQHLGLVVANGSPIARMFSITALDRVVAVHAGLAEALHAVRENGDDTAGAESSVATPD